MKVIIRECYLEAGFSYHFSHIFSTWLGQELGKRIRPSKSFLKAYAKGFVVGLSLGASSDLSRPEVDGPKVFRRDKEVIIYVLLPHPGGPCPFEPRGYARAVKQLLESAVIGFRRLGLSTSRIEKDTSALLDHFISRPEMIFDDDWDKCEVAEQQKKLGQPKAREPGASRKVKARTVKSNPVASRSAVKQRTRIVKVVPPKWRIPKRLQQIVEEDGMWEDERWDPILLTVMSGTSYEGHDIPLAWQIEFDPFDDRLQAANEKIETSGIEPDGDGWSRVIEKKFTKQYPKLAKEFHSDSESSTCVIWVESEDACRKLIEVVGSMMHLALASTASA